MQRFCSNCGQELKENVNFCPNCGNSLKKEDNVDNNSEIKFFSKNDETNNNLNDDNYKTNCNLNSNSSDVNAKSNMFAIIGFTLSLCSFITVGLTSFWGLIFSIIGLVNSKKYEKSGKGFAIAGIIISLLFLIMLIAFYSLFIFGTSSGQVTNPNIYNGPMY